MSTTRFKPWTSRLTTVCANSIGMWAVVLIIMCVETPLHPSIQGTADV